MHEALSETLASAIRLADTEARNLNQEFVGTEHLLLGIIAAGDGDAVHALKLATDIGPLRKSITDSLPRGSEAPLITGRLPFSPKAQRAINTAIAAAQAAGLSSVSTRFVLQALVDESQSAAEQMLKNAGADLENLKRVLRDKPASAER